MIGYLKGDILQAGDDQVLLNVNSVGYEVFCSEQVLTKLIGETRTEFWIHTHVREDQLSLFGFLTKSEKQFFLS
ncbi:MAG: OB-fold domain-containing protein, partial [Bdellovibrionota bacterium]